MDAGACVACQHPLGEIYTEEMLGLFPRVRCLACGLVNVLSGTPTYSAPVAASYEEEAPAAYEEAPVAYQEAPVAYGDAPVAYEDAPAYEEASGGYEEAPGAYEEAPGAYEEAPASAEMQGEPEASSTLPYEESAYDEGTNLTEAPLVAEEANEMSPSEPESASDPFAVDPFSASEEPVQVVTEDPFASFGDAETGYEGASSLEDGGESTRINVELPEGFSVEEEEEPEDPFNPKH